PAFRHPPLPPVPLFPYTTLFRSRWILRRVGNWAAVFVDPGGPIDSREGSRKKAASRSAVQHKEITISRSLQQHLSGDTLEIAIEDRKSTRLNSSHVAISYAVFCL